jgi:AAA family ATP:ADP antiporter
MKFFTSFNYTILHATKDTLIVTGKGSGAEVIPILKGWLVIVSAFLFMLIYSKLSNVVSRSKLFYISLMPFLIFFALYGFVLSPYRSLLSPDASADWLTSVLGSERSHWIAVYRNWIDSAFFLMAELWGGVVIGLLFWGLANRISTIHEASRFYTILSAGGHVGVIIAGPLIWHFASAYSHSEYVFTLYSLMGLVTICNVFIIGLYWYIDNYISVEKPVEVLPKTDQPKANISLYAGLKHVLSSPYLGCIALMVIGYGMSVNMIEVIWKATLKLKYPNSNDYQAFMGMVSSCTGVLSLLLALFVGGNVIRRFGWYWGAQSTPIILGVASMLFLGVYFSSYYYEGSTLMLTAGSLALLVICGAFHNVACKSMKYCLFDPTKEMAYIPLDEEAKVKGKAAVDVVASRFGKSGSSWIQVGLMEIASVSSVLGIAMWLTPFVLIAIVGWTMAIHFLGYQHKESPSTAKPEPA